MRLLLAIVSFVVVLSHAALSDGPKRVAFVVGNQSYSPLSALSNPVRDARVVADILAGNGYRVSYHANVDHASFTRAIDAFVETSKDAHEALVFYSGHGMGVVKDGQFINALAPVDASIDCKTRQAERIVAMEDILERLGHVPHKLAMFDACRSEPCRFSGSQGGGFGALRFSGDIVSQPAGATTRGTPVGTPARGFVPVGPDKQSTILVAFATDLGAVALDGTPGGHSPFAEALIEQLRKSPKVPYRELLDATAERVAALTGKIQNPWVVTKGGEPQTCLAGTNCEGRGRLRLDRALSDAMGSAFDAQRLRGNLELHAALETTLKSVEALHASGIEIPEALRRQFHELMVLAPRRRVILPADIQKLDVKLGDQPFWNVRFSADGRIGALIDNSDRIIFIDFEQMKLVHRTQQAYSLDSNFALSPDGSHALVCRNNTGPRARCGIILIDGGKSVAEFELPANAISQGDPQIAGNNRFAAIGYLDTSGAANMLKILLQPTDVNERSVILELPRDEVARSKKYIDGVLIRIARDGTSIAALGPTRLHLFSEKGGKWSGTRLEGIYDQLGTPDGYNLVPSFDIDFASRRFAFSTPAIPVVIVDFDVAGDRMVSRQKFHFTGCKGCSVLGFASGGRQIALGGLGTDGYVGAFSLPIRLEWPTVEQLFMIKQTARVGAVARSGARIIRYDIEGKELQFLDLDRHPIRTSRMLAGRDQLYAKRARSGGRVDIFDSTAGKMLEFDAVSGAVVAEQSADRDTVLMQRQVIPQEAAMFFHDDRYGKDQIVAAASLEGTPSPRIHFYLPKLGTGPNPTGVAVDSQTLVVANDGNGRIDVLRIPLTIDQQIATAREILGISPASR